MSLHSIQCPLVGLLDVRKVDLCFNGSHRLDNQCANRFALAPQRSTGNPLSLATLGFCFGVDKLTKTLNLREVDFSIEEGAPGKLACFGRTQTPDLAQRRNSRRTDCATTGYMELEEIFPGKAVWTLKSCD